MYTIHVDGALLYQGRDPLAAMIVYLRYVGRTYRIVQASIDGRVILTD